MTSFPKRTIRDRQRAEVDASSAAPAMKRELHSIVPTSVDPTSTHVQITREIAERMAAEVVAVSTARQQRIPYWVDHPGERSYLRVPQVLRQFVLNRDSWICTYCELPLTPEIAEIDHVYPRADGAPSHALDNLAAACWWCNRGANGKHRRTPEEWKSWRLRKGLSWPPPQHAH
jgi:hypothetical protein